MLVIIVQTLTTTTTTTTTTITTAAKPCRFRLMNHVYKNIFQCRVSFFFNWERKWPIWIIRNIHWVWMICLSCLFVCCCLISSSSSSSSSSSFVSSRIWIEFPSAETQVAIGSTERRLWWTTGEIGLQWNSGNVSSKEINWVNWLFFLFFDHYYFLFLYSFIYFLGGNKFPIQFPTTNDSHYLSFYLLLACETWQDRNSIVDSFPVLWCVHVRLLPIDAALPHLPQIAPIISNSCRLAQIHATSSSLFHFLVVWWARWHPCGGTYSNLSFNFNFLWIDRINVGIFIVFFSSSKIQLNLYSNIFPTVGRNEIKSDKVEREAIFWLDSSDVATLRRACGPIRYVAMSDLRGFSFFFVYFVCLFVLFFFFFITWM